MSSKVEVKQGPSDLQSFVEQNIKEAYELQSIGPQQPLASDSAVSAQKRTSSSGTASGPRARAAAPASRPSEMMAGGSFSNVPDIDEAQLDMANAKDALIKCQKVRIRSLEQQLQKFKKDLADTQMELCESEGQCKLLRNERVEWCKSKKNLELQAERFKNQYDETKVLLATKTNHVAKLKQDSTDLEKNRRLLEQDIKAREVRLSRALDEVDKYKQQLTQFKQHEREGKETSKTDYNQLLSENKKLERQKNELVLAFKKQLKLIDVLKRQKVHMEAARTLEFTEEEFVKTLGLE